MSHLDRHRIIPSVYLIALRGNETLLSLRQNTGFEDGKYGLVAGHAEEKESLTQALMREIEEEAGIRLDPSAIKLALTMHRNCGDHERMDFFFTCDRWEGELENREPEKCGELRWVPIDQLPENCIPYIRRAIECVNDGVAYDEFNFC